LTVETLTTAKTLVETPAAPRFPAKYGDWAVFSLLLAATLLTVWLPVDWIRNLKRYQQADLYFWLGLGYSVVFAGAAYWFSRRDDDAFRARWVWLALLVLLPNVLNIWVRYATVLPNGQPLFGRDADIGLFFKYASDVAQGLPPTYKGNPMEYPQGALYLFMVGERLAGGDLEKFYWIFPAWLLVWQGVAAAALYGIGIKVKRARWGFWAAVFLAGAPFLQLFNYTRFDIAPAGILLAAIYFFLPGSREGFRLPRRESAPLAGIGIAFGFLAKWLPAIAAPFLAMVYFRLRRWRELVILSGSAALVSGIVMLPYYLADSNAFFYPYKWQSSRNLQGESVWFLLQYFVLDPRKTEPERPWSEPGVILLSNNLLQAFQIGGVLLVFALGVWFLRQVTSAVELYDRWAGLGLVAVAVFTLLNRVFSPQYMVLIMWVLGAALILRPAKWYMYASAGALLTLASYSNLMVFHLAAYPEDWRRHSLVFFAVALGICGVLIWFLLNNPKNIKKG
jgi:hypothetical protein